MKESVRILLDELIDYAGLFPPAGLEMRPAVENYAAYLRGDYAWMLGRFIVPVARLGEFEEASSELLPRGNPVYPWRLSVLAGGDLAADLKTIIAFNRWHATDENAGAAVVDTLELKADASDAIERASWLLPRTLTAYFEIPLNRNLENLLDALAARGRRAKVRTGGVTEQAFPSPAELAQFISACAARQVAFKATAGLHHPLRASHRLTYEPDSASATMHGFLNVFLAAAFARFGLPEEGVRELLEEASHDAFAFDDEGVRWRGHQLTLQRLAVARGQFAAAFGSCSFEEPVEDLKRIGLL
jgi:hypothetical protein